MSDLKPCPFCGGKAELLTVPANSGLSGTKWVVVCKKRCCNQYPHISDHDAIEAWNRRVNDERQSGTEKDPHGHCSRTEA